MNVYEDSVTYSCNNGYEFRSQNALSDATCEANGLWEPNVLDDCQPVSCGYPPDAEHVVLFGDEHIFNSTVTYGCENGYELTGPSKRVCLSSR